MQQEELLVKIDALKEQLLNALIVWYKEQTEVLQQILFVYENIFGNIEVEIEQKEKNAKQLEQKYKILARYVDKKEPVSRKSVEFIDKLLFKNDARDKKHTHTNYNYSTNRFFVRDNYQKLDPSVNDDVNITNLYRNIIKQLHPDIIQESNIFNLCWHNVQYCYKKQDVERLKMFYLILCAKYDELDLNKVVDELKNCIEKQHKEIKELQTQEPFCFKDKLNDSKWITERQNHLRSKLIQVNKRINHNKRLLNQIKIVD